jgi:Flp pilus assembly protein TadG
VIFGTIQFSVVVFGYNSVAFAARAGTRYAIVNGSSSPSPCTAAQVQTVVLENLAGIPTAVVTVTTTWISNNNPGSTVKVVVSANFSPMVKWVMPSTINVNSTSEMIILQ